MTRVRRTAGMISASALAAGALVALPAASAQAAQATTDYSCMYSSFGPYEGLLKTNLAAPAKVSPGQTLSLSGDVTYTWDSEWSDLGRSLSMQFKEVEASVPVVVNGTELATPATLTFADEDVAVPASGNMVWPGELTLPTITSDSAGPLEVKLGNADFDMQVALSFSGGVFTPAEIGCTLDGAAPSIATVKANFASMAAVKVAGKAAVGNKLTASGGATKPAGSVSYRWTVGGKAAGNGKTLTLKPGHKGKVVKVTATATKALYNAKSTTKTVGKVAAGSFKVKGKAKIKGKAKVGKKLTVAPGKIGGAKVKYQWLKNGKAIKKAKGKKLKLKKAFRGKKISVKVTYTKSGYKTVVQKTKAVKVKK